MDNNSLFIVRKTDNLVPPLETSANNEPEYQSDDLEMFQDSFSEYSSPMTSPLPEIRVMEKVINTPPQMIRPKFTMKKATTPVLLPSTLHDQIVFTNLLNDIRCYEIKYKEVTTKIIHTKSTVWINNTIPWSYHIENKPEKSAQSYEYQLGYNFLRGIY